MQQHEVSQAVHELLVRTGIGQQLAAEVEAQRAARHAELRQAKAATVAAVLEARPKIEAAVVAAEGKQKAAQQAAEAALQEWIAARGRLSALLDGHSATLQQIEPEMRRCCDPRIEDFKRELVVLRDVSADLYRTIPDPKGTLVDAQGRRMRNNRAEIDRRTQIILDTIDAAERLKVAHDIDDVGAEIERLRNAIPGA